MLGTRIAAKELNWPFLVPALTACPGSTAHGSSWSASHWAFVPDTGLKANMGLVWFIFLVGWLVLLLFCLDFFYARGMCTVCSHRNSHA